MQLADVVNSGAPGVTGAPPQRLCLSVGGISVEIASVDPTISLRVDDPIRSFLVDDPNPDTRLQARWNSGPLEPVGDLVFDSKGSWQLHRAADTLLFTVRAPQFGVNPYKRARLNAGLTAGEVEMDPRLARTTAASYPLEYPLDELVMVHALARGKGVEIHGCAVIEESGRALLFAGQSGDGKSTLAGLWKQQQGARLLSDERVVVRTDDNRLDVYGTPWHGDALCAAAASAPLGAIFFLRHGQGPLVRGLPRPAAVARLVARSFVPFHDAAALQFTLEALERVTSQVPCFDLAFSPDPSVFPALAAALP